MRSFPLRRESLRTTRSGFSAVIPTAGQASISSPRSAAFSTTMSGEKKSVFDDLPQTENGGSWLCYAVSEDFFPWLEGEVPSP